MPHRLEAYAMLCYIDLPERRGMFEEIFTGKSTQPTAKRDSVMQLRFRACLPRFTLVNSRTELALKMAT